jgi:hypothetical protein
LKGKDQYFIYQEFANKIKDPFNIWLNPEFWLKWFQIEIKERENSLQKIEDFFFFILSEMATNMNNLNIELKIIVECIVNKIAFQYIKEDILIIKDLEKSITKQYEFMHHKEI